MTRGSTTFLVLLLPALAWGQAFYVTADAGSRCYSQNLAGFDYFSDVWNGSSNAVSAAMWLKPDANFEAVYPLLLAKMPAANSQCWLQIRTAREVRVLQQAVGGGNIYWQTAAGVVTSNRWQHLAFAFNLASQTCAIWVDGVSIANSKTISGTAPTTLTSLNVPLTIGNSNAAPWFPCRAAFADVRIYNVVLSDAEVRTIAGAYPRGTDLMQRGLVARWFSRPAYTVGPAWGMPAQTGDALGDGNAVPNLAYAGDWNNGTHRMRVTVAGQAAASIIGKRRY